MLNVGDKFKLSDDALENYGHQWESVIFKVTSWANKYVSADVYFDNPLAYPHSHPGYDGSGKERLYDAEPVNSDMVWDNSVYDWEIKAV